MLISERHLTISYDIFYDIFWKHKPSVTQTEKMKHTSMQTIYSVFKQNTCLIRDMPQLKMTYHLDPRAGVCRAAVGRQCSLSSRKGFEIQMCCYITMPCATNGCLIIWGKAARPNGSWMDPCSALPAIWMQTSHTHTHSGGTRRSKMTFRFLFLCVVVLNEVQLGNSTKGFSRKWYSPLRHGGGVMQIIEHLRYCFFQWES